MEVRKEIIRSGKHVYIGEDGRPAVLDATPAKIAHYHANGNEMIKRGLPIPVPLEHQPSATPMNAMDRAADLVRNNAGEAKRFEVDTIKNPTTGEDIHRLFGVLDIRDDKIAEKVNDGSIRWVSPWINSFVDGKGSQWDEVISHVALTTRPRIHEQQPFDNVSMALSIVGHTKPTMKIPQKGICFSRAGTLKSDGKPCFPIAFSLLTGVKLSEDDLKNLKSEDDDDESGDDDSEGVKKGDVDPEGDPAATEFGKDDTMAGMDAESGDVSFEELIPHLLEMHGISVPAGGKGKEFLQALVQGLLASAKAFGSNGNDDNVLGSDPAAAGGKPPPSKSPVVQESPPMYMSMTRADIAKIKDSKERQTAEAFLSMREQVESSRNIADSLRKSKIDEASGRRQSRIERVCKAVSPKNRDKIIAAASQPSMQLSMIESGADAGKIVDPMATMLEIFEEELGKMPELLKKDARFGPEPHPQDGFGEMTDAQAEELANRQLNRHSRAVTPVS